MLRKFFSSSKGAALAGLFFLAFAGSDAMAFQIIGPSGKCLEVVGAVNVDGTPVQLHQCQPGNRNQDWTYDANTKQAMWAGSGKCLDVSRGNAANGAVVQIWQCSANNRNQKFDYRNPAIIWSGTNKCLDLRESNTGNGAAAQMWDCLNNANQRWSIK